MIELIIPPGAPAPQGPYSPAVRAGGFLYVSGQGPVEPDSGELRLGDIALQTRLVLENVRRVLEGCGAGLQDVIKCSVFLAEAADFAAMNAVYAEFFGAHKPARTTVQAILVEPGMKVEIDCVAWRPTADVSLETH
jgi:2-iminobutanoate/2-iminopropanoate deaminase